MPQTKKWVWLPTSVASWFNELRDRIKNKIENLKMKPKVEIFSDPETNNATYLVRDPASNACAVIDSLLSFDLFSGRFSSTPHKKLLNSFSLKG